MDEFEENTQVIKKSFINREIPHLEQITMDDCGVACFKMAMK